MNLRAMGKEGKHFRVAPPIRLLGSWNFAADDPCVRPGEAVKKLNSHRELARTLRFLHNLGVWKYVGREFSGMIHSRRSVGGCVSLSVLPVIGIFPRR